MYSPLAITWLQNVMIKINAIIFAFFKSNFFLTSFNDDRKYVNFYLSSLLCTFITQHLLIFNDNLNDSQLFHFMQMLAIFHHNFYHYDVIHSISCMSNRRLIFQHFFPKIFFFCGIRKILCSKNHQCHCTCSNNRKLHSHPLLATLIVATYFLLNFLLFFFSRSSQHNGKISTRKGIMDRKPLNSRSSLLLLLYTLRRVLRRR